MRRFAVLSALLSAALCSAQAAAAMKTAPVEWTVGEDAFSGYLVYDDASEDKRPGLVMVPNWMGVTDEALERARAVAGDDYVVLVADVYGKGNRPKDSQAAGAATRAAFSDGGRTLRARANEALRVLRAQAATAPLDPAKIGAFGFCFGGTVALELARSGADLAGVVSFHGGLQTWLPTAENKVGASVLVLNGADDTAVTDEHIAAFEKEMDAAKADWQFVDFSGAAHCFAEPGAGDDPASNCRYDERAAKRAYRMMDGFFDELFGDD